LIFCINLVIGTKYNSSNLNYRVTEEVNIPSMVANQEKVVRVVYSPVYTKRDQETNEIVLKYQTFRSPPDKDEVSVTRLDYSSPDICKRQGKAYEDKQNKRTYYGLAVLLVKEIRDLEADVIATPIPGVNEAHADITIGHIPVRGEQLPLDFKYKVETMAEIARLYEDKNPDVDGWDSDELV
jgi:hypothetical protein